jgi:hypothetical protein
MVCDSVENYFFMLQDEAQGLHWNNYQETITCRWIVTHQLNNNFCLTHDTTAVHLFHFLHNKLACLNKIHYFSAGLPAQYKNKKNINFTLYEDFGVPAEWHFSTTSHSKSACDILGGTINRLAASVSIKNLRTGERLEATVGLQRSYTDQMTHWQWFNWEQTNIQYMTEPVTKL